MTQETDFDDRLSIRRSQRDFDDLQNEIAGREVGRMRRFRTADDDRDPRSKDRRESQRLTRLSALEALLATDPVYRGLYEQTLDQLRRAEAATEAALAKARAARDRAQEDFLGLLDRAATMPDGTRVFRDADGNVRREDGRLVSGDSIDTIRWPDRAPDYENYQERKAALDRAQQAIEEVRVYQVDVLGAARDELTDPNKPASKERLREIQRDIEERNPAARQSEHPVGTPVDAEQPAPARDTAIPVI